MSSPNPSDPQLPASAADAVTGREPMLPVPGGWFGLIEAKTADERMSRLCAFIEFWLGPRKPEYGEPEEALARTELPTPLRTLLAFAGRWPAVDARHQFEYGVGALSTQDWLKRLDQIERADDGKLIFIWENQGVWNCRTLPTGDDPPVWCVGDPWDGERRRHTGAEVRCSDSLSRFLVTFVLQELTFGSRVCLGDDRIDKLFEASEAGKSTLWRDGPYVDDRAMSFHLWNGTVVGEMADSRWFAANQAVGIDFINGNQSPIDEVGIHLGMEIDLSIRANGSGRIRVRGGEIAEFGRSTFDFPSLEEALRSAIGEKGDFDRDASVGFRRSGQGGGVRLHYLRDREMAIRLFELAAQQIRDPSTALKRGLAAIGVTI